MRRFVSQLAITSDSQVARNTVVEISETEITNLIDLRTSHSESSHTVFIDGIMSGEIISLKARNINPEIVLEHGFQYLTISQLESHQQHSFQENLIFDFETENTEEITQLLNAKFNILSNENVIEIIKSCTTVPATLLGLNNQLKIGNKTQALIWQNINLLEKRLTPDTIIKKL